MRKSVNKIIAKGQQAMGTSNGYQIGECNENIENLLKIIKHILKKITSKALYFLKKLNCLDIPMPYISSLFI